MKLADKIENKTVLEIMQEKNRIQAEHETKKLQCPLCKKTYLVNAYVKFNHEKNYWIKTGKFCSFCNQFYALNQIERLQAGDSIEDLLAEIRKAKELIFHSGNR